MNESELNALYAITLYGLDEFKKCFYEHLGKHYLQPHEKGLETLFYGVKRLSGTVSKVKELREEMNSKL